MNNTTGKQYISETRDTTEDTDKLENLDLISVPSTSTTDNPNEDATNIYASCSKYMTQPESTMIMKIDCTSSSSMPTDRDNSSSITSDYSLTVNDDLTSESKRTSDSIVDLEIKKGTLNSSDVVLIEEYEKSSDEIKNLDTSSKKILEISGSSDVHIIESPDKIINLKSPNDSVQIVTSDPDTSVVLNNSDVSKPLPDVNSFKKILSEDSAKFISPVYSDSKKSSDRIFFEPQPAYSTPNDEKPPTPIKAEIGGSSTESLTSLPPIYKEIGFYVRFSAAIHMNKEVWTGEMINMCFDTIPTESLPPRLSDTSGHLGDISKSVSPSSNLSTIQLPLKSARISMASSSSSSSGLSSASTLAAKLRDNKFIQRNKKDEIKLSEENISALHEKWINSSDICNNFLAYIDRHILSADSFINDDSLKDKPVVEEHKVVKEVKEPLEKIEEVATPVSTNKVRPIRGKRQAKVKFTTDSLHEIPKKRQRRVESCEISQISSNFNEGDSVFAKWGDRKFYAATLGVMNADGKWEVNFFDGDKKTLLEEFLIKAEDYTTMVGSNVYASQGDDNFTPGIITGFDVKDGVLQYIVVRDKGDISVPCQFIYITESQARQIRGKTTNSTRNPVKSTENVLSSSGSKRSTRSKTKQMLDSPKPSVSGTQQAVHSDSDDDEKDDNSEINMEDVAGVEPESHGVYENGIKLKGKTLTGKMRFARSNKVNDTDANVLGPVPEEGSKYFKNFHVLLTCTRPQSPKLQVSSGNSSGNATSSETENYNFSAIPFVKDRLKLQLQMGGATVYNNFDDIPQKLWKSTYLISNRPNISAKYIQCLAAGIKVLCHEWVIRCCIEKKKLCLQELPLGWSLERERYFNYYDKKSSNALKKMNLVIADTGDKNFIKFWTKICKLADININKLTRDSNLELVTAVVSESGYKDEHIERVMSHNIPIVTTTWIIQSLLHGEPRQFDAHKSYVTEYVDSD